MNSEKLRIIISRILLAFVFVTVGFSIGRRTAPVSVSEGSMIEAVNKGENKVIVYAVHMTFRCPECNQIEWFARALVENEFKDQLDRGEMEFRAVDYMQNTEFALRYNISSSTIVISKIVNGEETGFKRLDEVWTKVGNRDEYFDYVRAAILESLEGGK